MSGQRVGVFGDEGLVEAVESAGGEALVDPPDIDSLAFAIVVGETALVDFARELPDVPVLPVDTDDSVRSIPRSDARAAIEGVLDGGTSKERHPILSVTGPFEGAVHALLDVSLMAAEPARISEFSLRSDGETVAEFRADGVVVSTPAGSRGYNRAADGPVVSPRLDSLAAVPIAPFATDSDHWMLPIADLSLAVERDETPVALLADGEERAAIPPGEPVELARAGELETFVVPESEPFF